MPKLQCFAENMLNYMDESFNIGMSTKLAILCIESQKSVKKWK